MKRVNLILWVVVVFLLFTSSQSFSWIYVCLDPGHGGDQSGNVGRVYGLLEKDVNLGVGLMTYSHLVSWYWWPIITRTEDIDIDRPRRANTNKTTCDILENY